MTLSKLLFVQLFALVFVFACSGEKGEREYNEADETRAEETSGDGLLQSIDPEQSGVTFVNVLEEDNRFNYFFNEYMYNGAGVAIGDIDNDGRPDLFFTGNQEGNALYLNRGDLQFEDITEKAGVKGSGWQNGACMADFNGDGWLDIYVCKGGSQVLNPERRRNLLFINNGDLTFTESASEYGVDDPGYSLNAAVLDMDRDGDLDLFVTNYPPEYDLSLTDWQQGMNSDDQHILDHLYRNEGGSFTEVSKEYGVNGFGHGLGIAVGDINRDGYPDIYVANDYVTDDYIYINQEGRSFRESVRDLTKHTSLFSMGADIADFNNDSYLDIAVADMNPEDNFRSKAAMPSMNPEAFFASLDAGLHPQWMRNALQLGSESGIFSEIGQMAGMARTDWSWAMLFVDLDLDGWKDLLITNGLLRDVDEKDINKHFKEMQKEKGRPLKWEEVEDQLNSTPLQNYWMKNKGDLTFERYNRQWNATETSFSNGAAFGDLDGDGDPEVVISNVNQPALIYKNRAVETKNNNYLKVRLEGDRSNVYGVGSKVTLKAGEDLFYQELYPYRGYMSSSEPVLIFGLGDHKLIEEIEIDWYDGRRQVLENVEANQEVVYNIDDAGSQTPEREVEEDPLFRDVTEYTGLAFKHSENAHDDYEKQVLLPHEMSRFGPALAVGDLNGDGFDDVYIGGAAGQAGKIYIQTDNFRFQPLGEAGAQDASQEDVGAVIFDADGDGDNDLYIVSGGFAFPEGSEMYQDRLYINDGGGLRKAQNALPTIRSSGSCAVPADFDGDGDLDLFVGGRVVPDKYPYAPQSYLLVNDGSGKFSDGTDQLAPGLREAGMIADAAWTDLNGDGRLELLLAGDWTRIMAWSWNGSKFVESSERLGLPDKTGWWNCVIPTDLDGDGDMDLVAGNLGKNYKYQASEAEPFEVYCDDFDDNGTYDIVLGYFYEGTQFPVRGLQCSSEQMPFVKKKFPHYNEFASASLRDIYGDKLEEALHLTATEFSSGILWNDEDGFKWQALPQLAQISPVMDVVSRDFDGDGRKDLLTAGNLMVSEVETGNADAGLGLLLLQEGVRSFNPVTAAQSGFFAPMDVRRMAVVNEELPGSIILVANNNNFVQSFGYTAPNEELQ